MDAFAKKYGIKEDEQTKALHRNRRIFCIYRDKLRLAEKGATYTHAIWFEKEGWMSKEDDALMDEIVRGMVDGKGDVYFYIGYNFEVNEKVEKIFFPYLKELVETLRLNPENKVFGGFSKGPKGFAPKKSYGVIKDNL